MPTTLWAQRKRWARGQGEVLHVHVRRVFHWRTHRMWLIGLESLASLLWVIGLFASLALSVANVFLGRSLGFFAFGLAWGVAISIVATVQLIVALSLRYRYDRWGWRSMLVGAVYLLAFWTVSATAALAAQITALFKGPRERRVVWDIPREPVRRRGPQARSNVATNVPSAASSESRSPSMR